MSSIRSLTAALALALAIPFAGAHASDDCTEAISIQSASKGSKIAPVTDSKHTTKTAKQPKAGFEPGSPHTIIPSTDKKTSWAKAFQKYKGHCC